MLTVTVTGPDGVWFKASVSTEVVSDALNAAAQARVSNGDITGVSVHIDQ